MARLFYPDDLPQRRELEYAGRRFGSIEINGSHYSLLAPKPIEAWHTGGEPDDARRITDRSPPARKRRDVYVYFDNDARGHASHDALRLARRLGLPEDG